MKVLMATDGSCSATSAMRTAMRLLNPAECDVDLLCVAPAYSSRTESAPRERYEERILGETNRILQEAENILLPDARNVNVLAEIGSPGPAIAAKTGDYDVTVLGAQGIGFRNEAGLGPVVNRVAEHALGPVLIGRKMRSEEGVRILIPVDGSAAARLAVETVDELCDLNSAEICLMYVAETPWLNLATEGDWATASEEEMERSEPGILEKEFLREGRRAIEEARNILARPHLLVNCRSEEGNPAGEILAEAERGAYDLVAVGATGNRDLKHSMLGSVSSRVAWEAPCSVLIVREPGETG